MIGRKGFSLIEVLIAMAISIFLITVILAQNLSMFNSQMYNITRSNLAQDTLLEANYLMNQIIGIGGGSVRAWMSIWVEDNCTGRGPLPGCAGSDRMTVSLSHTTPLECPIDNQNGNLLTIDAPAGICCLTLAIPNPFNSQLMIVNGNSFSQVYPTKIDTAACTITFQPGQAAGNPFDQSKVVPAPPNNWATGGVVAAITVETYYLDANHFLNQFADTNNNGVIDGGENLQLAASVFDFQLALGYDVTGSSVLTDDGTKNDCWLYNSAADTGLLVPGFFATTQPNQMRMVELALTSGVINNYTNVTTPQPAQLLDGPAVVQAGTDMRSISFKITPRNNYIFQ